MRYLIILVLVSACGGDEKSTPPPNQDPTTLDQCIRREIFIQCLSSVPKGPERVSDSNDWDEVVSECYDASTRMAYRLKSQVKIECQP